MSLASWLFWWWTGPTPDAPPTTRGRWRWTLDDENSDLAGPPPTLWNRRLLRFPDNEGTFVATIAFGATEAGYYFSPAGQPGNSFWPGGLLWTVQVYVFVANPNINLRVGMFRYDEEGNPVEVYALSSPQNLGSTGPKAFTGLTFDQFAAPKPTPGHRLRLLLLFDRPPVKSSGDVTLGFGNPDRDFVEVPIAMGATQINWNGNTLVFPGPLTDYLRKLRSDGETDVSGGGVVAGLLHHYYFQVQAQLARFTDAQFRSDLEAFWSWAEQRKQFAFALDAADVVDLVLNGSAAAGQKDIPLADTSTVVVGKEYRLREAAGPEFEVIKVASIVTNVKAVAQNNLKFGYVSGDSFRSLDYFPKMVALDADEPVIEHPTNWTLELLMREDKG
jgi:hypothetical protein